MCEAECTGNTYFGMQYGTEVRGGSLQYSHANNEVHAPFSHIIFLVPHLGERLVMTATVKAYLVLVESLVQKHTIPIYLVKNMIEIYRCMLVASNVRL